MKIQFSIMSRVFQRIINSIKGIIIFFQKWRVKNDSCIRVGNLWRKSLSLFISWNLVFFLISIVLINTPQIHWLRLFKKVIKHSIACLYKLTVALVAWYSSYVIVPTETKKRNLKICRIIEQWSAFNYPFPI
jgi:hypothetical protein